MSEPNDIKTIVKLERPAQPGGDWLAYDAQRSRVTSIARPPADVVAAMAGEPRAHFAALWVGERWARRGLMRRDG
jgi:hypothetical protein